MENKPSEHFSNRFTIRPTDGPAYLDYEMLKQNMLSHEATFRKQVEFYVNMCSIVLRVTKRCLYMQMMCFFSYTCPGVVTVSHFLYGFDLFIGL
jgi:hypothetical protein